MKWTCGMGREFLWLNYLWTWLKHNSFLSIEAQASEGHYGTSFCQSLILWWSPLSILYADLSHKDLSAFLTVWASSWHLSMPCTPFILLCIWADPNICGWVLRFSPPLRHSHGSLGEIGTWLWKNHWSNTIFWLVCKSQSLDVKGPVQVGRAEVGRRGEKLKLRPRIHLTETLTRATLQKQEKLV